MYAFSKYGPLSPLGAVPYITPITPPTYNIKIVSGYIFGR